MSLLTILLTGVGLAMDALAVSISSGIGSVVPSRRNALKMALWFGGFQALMPAVGYFLGVGFRDWVAAVDHWVAFILLSAVGGKMIWEALGPVHEAQVATDRFTFKRLTLLAVATSIDALAVGITFSLLEISLLKTVAIIGLTTFLLCYPAVRLGRRLGLRFSKRAEIFGGLLLIGIGARILVEHTMLG